MRAVILAGLAVLVAGQAQAQPATQPPTLPAPAAASKFLAPGDLDPALVLPPPPADDAPAAAEGRAELHRIAATVRTPARLAQAKADDALEDVRVFAPLFGPDFDLARLPNTAKLFADLRTEDSLAAKQAKAFFKRERPWLKEPDLDVCDDRHDSKNSYPSGHATMGYAASAVLAELAPNHAQAVLARAADYAESRLVCGVHYRGDLEAGHVLATALIDRLMTKPQFRAEVEAARTELTAAHIAP